MMATAKTNVAPPAWLADQGGVLAGWRAGGWLVAAGLAAYANSLGGPFVFDDLGCIFENPTIARLWPLSGPLAPPAGGFTVSGRPLVNLSLAVNHAISGTSVWSYHVFNLLVHLLGGLLLFGLVRRTLVRLAPAERWRAWARPAAWLVALLWVLHPLQTESVTYIIQRAEAMMGLGYLAVLYAFARTVEAEEARPGQISWRWRITAIAACAAGMACKEVMATAPVAVWLYDRTFVSGGLFAALRRRPGFYAVLAATWLLLGALVLTTGDRGGTFRLTAAAFGGYWLTQSEALGTYLWRTVWPVSLAFDYGLERVALVRVLPYAAGVLALAGATVWLWWRRPAAGFCAVMFFVVLAPTSLMPGVNQAIVEHRMYVPLAAVLALGVVAAVARFGVAAWWAGLGLAVAAGGLTARRNADYADALTLWADTVEKRPQSVLAQSGLATAYYERGQLEEARRHNELGVSLDPEAAQVRYNLGLVLEKMGRKEAALVQFVAAAARKDMRQDAWFKQGQTLIALGRAAEALAPLEAVRAMDETRPEVHAALGTALAESGRWTEAVAADERALALQPDDAAVEANLGAALFQLGRLSDAEARLRSALRRNARLADAHFNLGVVLAATGREPEALARYADAVRLAPAKVEARLNLGIALAQGGRREEARAQLEAAVRLAPARAEAHANLGALLSELGESARAREELREALRLRPDYPFVQALLGGRTEPQ